MLGPTGRCFTCFWNERSKSKLRIGEIPVPAAIRIKGKAGLGGIRKHEGDVNNRQILPGLFLKDCKYLLQTPFRRLPSIVLRCTHATVKCISRG
mmetsp:Transcript_9703/g.14029  ORF Transcript_9703/g.14029 Transcript_9703/m.14029 type:complete len:94 (+) Transcript_9703:720-1001(+)